MPHSVAPKNAAVYDKNKAAYRLPPMRRSQRGIRDYYPKAMHELHDKITNKNFDSSL